jgi:hypothetical protein
MIINYFKDYKYVNTHAAKLRNKKAGRPGSPALLRLK